MRYYDIVFDSCNVDEKVERKLGFERIGLIPRDVALLDVDRKKPERNSRCIAYGSLGNLLGAANMGVAALRMREPTIDKRLIAAMAENGTALCIPISDITSLYGLKRSRTLYKVGKLFVYAKKAGVDVSLVTAAEDDSMLCSYMQIIEVAKLFGAQEADARRSMSEVNKRLLVE